MLDSLIAPLIGAAAARLLTFAVSEGVFTAAVPWLIRRAEESRRFPWLTPYSGRALKVCAAIAAASAAAGFKVVLDLDVAHAFTIEGLSQHSIGLFVSELARQLGQQEVFYQWVLRRDR